MSVFLSIVSFILILFLVIVIHELGHLLAAKWHNIQIAEFGIGFPPRLARLFTWGGTYFYLNAIPLGGYNMPAREEGEEEDSVERAPVGQRISVYLGGAAFNLLSALLVYAVLFVYVGAPDTGRVSIQSIVPGSPAAEVFQPDDLLVRLNGQDVASVDFVLEQIALHRGRPLQVDVEREGERLAFSVTPRAVYSPNEGALGVTLSHPYRRASLREVLTSAVGLTAAQIRQMGMLPTRLLGKGPAAGEGEVVGVKGMYDIYAQTVEGGQEGVGLPPLLRALEFFAAISISVGVINLYPIPALDGGRVLFALPELLLRRRIPAVVLSRLNMVGFAVLIAVALYVNLLDITLAR